MIFRTFADRTGSDSILSDRNWTWTEKFHNPLISADDVSDWPLPKQFLAQALSPGIEESENSWRFNA